MFRYEKIVALISYLKSNDGETRPARSPWGLLCMYWTGLTGTLRNAICSRMRESGVVTYEDETDDVERGNEFACVLRARPCSRFLERHLYGVFRVGCSLLLRQYNDDRKQLS